MRGSIYQKSTILTGFIVFEGLDGAGTTTQARLLYDRLKLERAAWYTCEPTDGPIGRLIRDSIGAERPLAPGSLAYLFAADRYEHLYHETDGIVARSSAGVTVICDRYLFSSLAYQGTLFDHDRVTELNAHFPLPEHVIYIDTPNAVTESRLAQRERRDQLEAEDVQIGVAAAYRRVMDEADRIAGVSIHRLDGTLGVNELYEQVYACVAGQ